MDEPMTPVEVTVLSTVYDGAMARCRRRNEKLAAVAKSVLFVQAALTPDGAEKPEGRPPLRPYKQLRKRIRFAVPQPQYDAAQAAILASGRSVSAAVEDGLSEYARTGRI